MNTTGLCLSDKKRNTFAELCFTMDNLTISAEGQRMPMYESRV